MSALRGLARVPSWVRMPRPSSFARQTVLAIAALASLSACVLDWDLPEDGDDGAGSTGASTTGPGGGPTKCSGTCTCPAGQTCSFECELDSCDIVGEAGSTVEVDCGVGSCDLVCNGAESCDMNCSSGSCSLACDGTPSCTQDCGTSSCDLTCNGADTCAQDCGAGQCGLICEDVASCSQQCSLGSCECTGC